LIGISVIVCVHNGVSRLRPTLTALAQCKADFPVEVIVVDNNSTDGTADFARAVWAELDNRRFAFQIVSESRQGLSFARQAGVRVARSDILVFCDDDNWLEPDYLAVAREIMEAHPEVGVLGGQSVAHFEKSPPRWFLRNQESFALGTQSIAEGDVTETRGWVWGAGFVVRAAALRHLEDAAVQQVSSDRVGKKQASGGDVEMCLFLRHVGWRIWYSPRLLLTHHMPSSRFDRGRFRSMVFRNGLFFAGVQYPLSLNGSRLWAALSSLKAVLRSAWRDGARFNYSAEMLFLPGKLIGFALNGRDFARSRQNRDRLIALRRAGPPTARETGREKRDGISADPGRHSLAAAAEPVASQRRH
jgi:glycosyltransferase involved in cell wall biosynthesis